MSNIRQYLQNQRNNVSNEFANADGFIDDDLNFTADEGSFMNADAGQANMGYSPAPTAQPYIITLTNVSATAISNFDVLGSYQYINNPNWANGSLTISGITIASGIPNVTYQEFLYQTMNSPYTVGLTYLDVLAGAAGQVSQTLLIDTRDANGNRAQKTFVPTIDPYQQQTGIISMKQSYRIDGYTKIVIASILASVTLRIQFYPSDNINIARGLAQRPVSRQFGNPNIVRSSVAVLPGGGNIASRLG